MKLESDNKTLVSVPVKKLKNKKLFQKVKRLKDFCANINSYIETMIFKLKLRQSLISPAGQQEIDSLVDQMVNEDQGKKVKISSIKVIYIHLRDNNLYPKCKFSITKISL
jgi:hypothetical protein